MREEALFEAALALPPEARPAYLAAACGADDRLRGQVERLLAADVGGSGILDGDPDQTLSPFRSHRPTLAADQVFAGRFRLVRKLGEGGMGEVWVADQTDPVQRAVALKVLRVGLGPDLFGRFEQERQALALMDHPSIAKVLDAGVTDDGPYFAMELIDGVPITRYCAARGLGPTDRLRLFVQVCQAVQHAHQKGVIHRDLKPDNVLVAEYDGRPVPKVIDFGVAKAAGVKLTGDTLRTGFGTIIGTLEYMAPEQATFDAQDIDTRADVYALGVLLYELLTGMTPIRRADFPKDKMLDVLQAIRETDPPRPSQRLAPAKAAAVRGDLDWIAMKCLAKNRADRYETANGLARDVERYLANEVVEARPPSAVYRVRKFVRRHTVALTAAAAVAIAVLVGGLVAVWQAVRALDAEKQALASERQAILDRDAKEAARLQALAEEQRATEEAALARAVQAFLEDDLLGQADVRNQRSEDGRDPNVTVRELLDRAADRIGDRFHNQPRTEAAIRHTIGAAYFALDDYPRARTHLDRALELQTAHAGPNHPSTLGTLTTLGRVRHLEGELGEAERLLTQALDGFREFRPADDFDVLVIERYLAAVYADRGRVDEAEAMLVRGRDLLRTKLTDRHSSTMSTTNQLGLLYLSVGRSADAAPLFDLVLGLVRERYSSDHPNVHTAMSHVAAALRDRGKLTEAAKMFAQVYGARLKLYGPDHADVYLAALNLGQVLSMGGAADRAEPLLGQAVAGLEKKFGKADDRTLTAKNSLAVLYMNQGRV
jgi:tetratricopeptide (TPR) repeat protein